MTEGAAPVEIDVKELRDDVVDLLRRLVTCDTSNPPGNETQAAAIIEEYLRPTGIECRRVAKDPNRTNLIARLKGRGHGPTLGFLGHLDVVQARREDWTAEPFAAIERDGAIWGRGTIDMKSQVAATVVALGALARSGFEPNGDIMLLLLADEEVGDAGVGSPFFVEEMSDLKIDFLVGEGAGERIPTPQGPIYLLDRGVKMTAPTTLTVRGRAGDASLAHAADSAVMKLGHLLQRLSEYSPSPKVIPEVEPLLDVLAPDATSDEERVAIARAAHPALDRLVASLVRNVTSPTVVEAKGPDNVVQEEAKVTMTCALLPGTTKEEFEAELRHVFGDDYDYELEVDDPEGGSISPADTPLAEAIEAFLEEHDPEARLIPALGYGFSDCDVFRKAYGAVTYGFIPFRHGDPLVNLETKHGRDERVLVDDLLFQVRCALFIATRIGASPTPE